MSFTPYDTSTPEGADIHAEFDASWQSASPGELKGRRTEDRTVTYAGNTKP